MYSTLEKRGKVIAVWSDAIGVGATSTTAALVAAGLATEDKKVLIFSTDHGPYDGVSVSSDLPTGTLMDDLVILATSGGIRSPEDFTPYVQQLSDNLFCLKGSNEFGKISVSASDALHRIIDMATYIYDVIVVDVFGGRSGITDQIIADSDLVMLCLSQNKKHLSKIASDSVINSYLDDKTAMLVVAKYQIYDFFTLKHMEKLLNTGGFYTLSDDDEIHRAVCDQNVADYVFRNITGATKGLLVRKKQEPSVAMSELKAILTDILDLFKEEEEEPPKTLFGRKKEEPKPEKEPEPEEDPTPPEERPEPPAVKKKKKKGEGKHGKD